MGAELGRSLHRVDNILTTEDRTLADIFNIDTKVNFWRIVVSCWCIHMMYIGGEASG